MISPTPEQIRERARQATQQLRDAAREGRVIDFRQRDPLVLAIHAAIDLSEKPLSLLDQRDAENATLKQRHGDHTTATCCGHPMARVSVPEDAVVEICWRAPNGAAKFWQIRNRHAVGSAGLLKDGSDALDVYADQQANWEYVKRLNEALDEANERKGTIMFSGSDDGKDMCCLGCHGPHRFDTSVPSVVWNAVVRSAGLPEYLCTTCIIEAFAKAGRGFTATLWGEGFDGLPIEIRVKKQPAHDAAAVQDENNRLRYAFARLTEAHERLRSRIAAIQPMQSYVQGEEDMRHAYRVGIADATREALALVDALIAPPEEASSLVRMTEERDVHERMALEYAGALRPKSPRTPKLEESGTSGARAQ